MASAVMASVGLVTAPAAAQPVTTRGGHGTVVFDVPDRTLNDATNPCTGEAGVLTFFDQQLVVVEHADAAGNLHLRTLYRGRWHAEPGGFSGRFVESYTSTHLEKGAVEQRSMSVIRLVGSNATNQIVVAITTHLRTIDGELTAQPVRYEMRCLR